MDRIEEALWRINHSTVGELNELRLGIIQNLDQFNHWRKKMREMENLFLINFVRPGFVLKQAVREREYLEDAYQRLHRAVVNQKIQSLSDLEGEISKVLHHADHAYDADKRSFEDEVVKEKNLWAIAQNLEPLQIVEQYDEDRIRRDFKKIVLPAVHPDTSETPVETFLTIKEVFEEGDYLLMEAYVAQYRGEIVIHEDQQDVLEAQEQLNIYLGSYHRLAERLERKLYALKKELTPEELDDPQKVTKRLNEQRDELRKLIQTETERILDLRSQIDGLVQLFLDIHRKEKDEP